jgi:hypothetical protein
MRIRRAVVDLGMEVVGLKPQRDRKPPVAVLSGFQSGVGFDNSRLTRA